MQIFVTGTIDDPELLGRRRLLKQCLCFIQRRVGITAAGENQDRRFRRPDVFNRLELHSSHAGLVRDHFEHRRGQRRTDKAQWTKPRTQSVANGVLDSRINGLEDERIHRQRLPAEQCRSATERYSDDANALARRCSAQERQCRQRIEALASAKGDVFASAFTVRLKVRREDAVAGVVEKSSATEHRNAIGADAVQEKNSAAARGAFRKPTAQIVAGSAPELNNGSAKCSGRRTNEGPRWSDGVTPTRDNRERGSEQKADATTISVTELRGHTVDEVLSLTGSLVQLSDCARSNAATCIS